MITQLDYLDSAFGNEDWIYDDYAEYDDTYSIEYESVFSSLANTVKKWWNKLSSKAKSLWNKLMGKKKEMGQKEDLIKVANARKARVEELMKQNKELNNNLNKNIALRKELDKLNKEIKEHKDTMRNISYNIKHVQAELRKELERSKNLTGEAKKASEKKIAGLKVSIQNHKTARKSAHDWLTESRKAKKELDELNK